MSVTTTGHRGEGMSMMDVLGGMHGWLRNPTVTGVTRQRVGPSDGFITGKCAYLLVAWIASGGG
jgi:hypothetical protein